MNILDKLVSIFLEFKPGKLILILLLLALIFIVIFPIIRHNYLYIWKMEKRIEMLKEISQINMEIVSKNERLNKEYNNIVNDLTAFTKKSDSITSLLFLKKEDPHTKKWKFITGAIIFWFMMLLIPFADYKNMKERSFAILVFLLIGAFLGFIGIIIPTFYNRYINFILYPLLQIILFAWIAVAIAKSQNNSN